MEKIYGYLKSIESAPGVPFHDMPQSFYPDMNLEEEGDFILFIIELNPD